MESKIQIDDLKPESWAASSNEALHISLAEPDGAFTFKPTFTYPIFGDSEQIFGYQDLRIDLAFNCQSLFPLINVKYTGKLSSDDIVDVKEKLLEFLPKETVFKDESKWLDLVEEENKTFKIPGEKVREYKVEDETYTIYKMNLKDPEVLKLHLRMQIFVLLFIEAGSYIDESDKVWEIYVIYKTSGETASFVGFSTVYSYWLFTTAEEHDKLGDDLKFNYRKKISQYVILPPYQQKGHGRHMYESIVDECLKDPRVKEITVEDPSEAFDDLRDRCDMERLFKQGVFSSDNGFNKLPIDQEWVEKNRSICKMEKRQFNRCIEMAMLHLLDIKSKEVENLNSKQIRLQMKKRLYIKNKEALVELDEPTRRDKLQTAFESLHDDYLRILEKVKFPIAKREANTDDDELSNGNKRIKT